MELSGLACHITVNFPWGSLLVGLLQSGSKVIGNLRMIAQPGATLAIVLNSSALLKEGLSLEQGGGDATASTADERFRGEAGSCA